MGRSAYPGLSAVGDSSSWLDPSVVMMGFRFSPFLRFFWLLLFPFAAWAAVVATFFACVVTTFLISAPFIIANAAAVVASNAVVVQKYPWKGPSATKRWIPFSF
jgi:hypothetical protein